MAETFDLLDVMEQLKAHGQPYYEFLRQDALSAGIYRLLVGEPDNQRPHTEDEIYYVLSGEAGIDIDGEVTPIKPGSVIYVEKGVPHHFVDYLDGLTVLVVFAPARGTGG
jgi:mannose-6-phosphate isomerase-like protein (cupin superfamily)